MPYATISGAALAIHDRVQPTRNVRSKGGRQHSPGGSGIVADARNQRSLQLVEQSVPKIAA
jgi:hypothetical protein